MGAIIPLGGAKAAERYLGNSTVAALPDPTTIAAGGYYRMTTAGVAHSVTFAIGDKAISNNVVWSVDPDPLVTVEKGGTRASNADDASLPGNLNYRTRDEVSRRVNSKESISGMLLASNRHGISPTILDGAELNDRVTIHFLLKFRGRPVTSSQILFGLVNAASASGANIVAGMRQLTGGQIDAENYDGTAVAKVTNVIPSIDYEKIYLASVVIDKNGDGLTAYIDGKAIGASVAIANTPNFLTSQKLQVGDSTANASGVTFYRCWVLNYAQTSDEVAEFEAECQAPVTDYWGGNDYARYESNFAGDSTDGWTADGSSGDSLVATDVVDGDPDNLKIKCGASVGSARMWKGILSGSYRKRVHFDYFFPSSNSHVDHFFCHLGIADDAKKETISVPVMDAWTEVEFEGVRSFVNGSVSFRLLDGGSSIIADSGDDFVAFRRIRITDLGVVLDVSASDTIGLRTVDRSPNKLDLAWNGAEVLNIGSALKRHSPSDSVGDVIAQITAGAAEAVMFQLMGDGLFKGFPFGVQRSAGQGYMEVLNSGAIANDAEWVIDDTMRGSQPRGFAFITNSGGSGLSHLFVALNGTAGAPAIISDPNSDWSVTEDTASKINIFRDAGNSNKNTIQNKSGSAVTLTVWIFNYYLA